MYFVNWQREVTVEEWSGQKVVVKRNKSTKELHEFLIIYAYSFISMLLVHPSAPPAFSETMRNEGRSMRNALKNIGISTPELISISNADLVEEYIEGGDLYQALASGGDSALANAAGCLTGRFHRAGYAFVEQSAELPCQRRFACTDRSWIHKKKQLILFKEHGHWVISGKRHGHWQLSAGRKGVL